MIGLLAILGTALLAAGGLTYAVVALAERRPGPLHLPAGIFCGYLVGAALVWSIRPADWTLPLSTTFAASVDAAKYGHPVEHYAEVILVWMMFGGIVSAVLGGLFAHWLGRRVRFGGRPPGFAVRG